MLNNIEAEILALFRQLTPEEKEGFCALVQMMSEENASLKENKEDNNNVR